MTDRNRIRKRAGKLLSDSAWSVAGLVLMNVAAQFAVYPVWDRRLGNEAYGNILYLIAMMNILAVSVGSAANYARMTASARGETGNRTYNRILLCASALAAPYMTAVCLLSDTGIRPAETALLILLTVTTMWRFYADVEYRLSLNYKGYFVYYLVIACGYGVGIGLFLLTGLWPLALLPGETAGLALVLLRGHVLRDNGAEKVSEETKTVIHAVATLVVTNLISNLIYNGDRVLLKLLMDGTAVAVYYQASLLGKTMSLVSTPLNSVLIGYLARWQRGMNRKLMHTVTLCALAAAAAGTAACTLASHVLIRLLYPESYETVRAFFWIANAAQVTYFVSNIVTTVLLRFFDLKYQVYVNTVYAALFLLLCIPATLLWKLNGFCLALLAVCAARLAAALWLGYRGICRQERSKRNGPEGSAG